VVNFTDLFKKNKMSYFTGNADSLEEQYFKEISFFEILKKISNPELIKLNKPTETRQVMVSDTFLVFTLNNTGAIFYELKTNGGNTKPIQVKPGTNEKIIEIISSLENENKLDVKNTRVIINASGSTSFSAIMKLQKALREKEISKINFTITEE
jgi:biopolymer transport protein ExbD